jgi:hypothetical protein
MLEVLLEALAVPQQRHEIVIYPVRTNVNINTFCKKIYDRALENKVSSVEGSSHP